MDRLVTWTTKLWKIVDHNPGVALALVLSAVLMTGCVEDWLMGRTDSSLTGKRSTGPEIRQAAEAQLAEVQLDRLTIQQSVAQAKREYELAIEIAGPALDANDVKQDRITELANADIDIADTRTESRAELVGMGLNVASAGIPGFGPFIPMLLAGGLGIDNLRTKRVLKREKNKNNGTSNA